GQFARGGGEPIGFVLRRTIFKGDRLTFDVAQLAQPLPEGIPLASVVDDANPRHPGRALLRARRERPGSRAAEQRDELAAPQLEHATSSQWADHGTLSLQ